MEGNGMQVMISSSNLAIWARFRELVQSRGLSLKRFHSIKQACETLSRENVILIFCENRLVDGTYEDLLTAAKNVKSEARIVVTGLDSDQFDDLGYSRARHLGAYDVLRKSYGIKDLEWSVICALRDEERVQATAQWSGRVGPIGTTTEQIDEEVYDAIAKGSAEPARVPV